MIKGSAHEEDITIINIYACNIGTPHNLRQMWTAIKGEIDTNTIIMGHINTTISSLGRSSRQKINKETQALNESLDQIDLIDVYRAFQKQQNTHSFQEHMEHSSGQITCWCTKQASVNLR